MKKKAIIFFADMRTTYDTTFYDEKKIDVSKKFDEFTKKISAIAESEGADVAFLSTVTNHKRHEDTLDIDYSSLIFYSWCMSCYIEGTQNPDTREITVLENARLGKSLYKDGYAVLNKDGGFGKYKMDQFSDDTELTQKAINYILELEKECDINKLFIIDDQVNTTFHKDAALDDSVIKNTLGKQIIRIRPCLPYHNAISDSNIDISEDCCVFSGKHTIDGVNECLDIYLNALTGQFNDESGITKSQSNKSKLLNKKY